MPASASQLAAWEAAPVVVFVTGEAGALQDVAAAAEKVGITVQVVDEAARLVASRGELGVLARRLRDNNRELANAVDDYLQPVSAWQLRGRTLTLERPHVMGIVNLTEDSFSGDGVGADIRAAVARAAALRDAGASIIDVGAESARADRPVMDAVAEAALVGTAVRALADDGHCVSVDTYKRHVAEAALDAGATIVNDISGLTRGTEAAETAIAAGAGYVLNYSYSVPKRRPDSPPVYSDVVTETVAWMAGHIERLRGLGMERAQLAIDPGIAFGKSHDEDIQMLRRVGELTTFGLAVLLAHSRKNFIGSINGQPPDDRDLETQVLSAMAYAQGVRIFRVHDVAGTRRAVQMAAALVSAQAGAFAPDAGSWPWRSGAHATHMVRGVAQTAAPDGQRW